MIFYRCKYLVTMDGPPIENGGLLVSDGLIVQCGRAADLLPGFSSQGGQVIDLGEVTVLPGLINAHCHLEFTPMRNLGFAKKSFAKWIQWINAAKRNLTDEHYLEGIRVGAAEALRRGTTTILNVESLPELLVRLPPLAQRMWWFYELIDIRQRQHSRESMRGAMRVFEDSGEEKVRFGLSPHAPYTVSRELFRLAREASLVTGLPLTVHVAESAEEMQMFREAEGPLHDFLGSLGRPLEDCGGTTPFRYLVEHELLPPGALLVHMNELEDADFDWIPRLTQGGALQVVHCPKSGLFFGHCPFRYDDLVAAGANVSLGTDSLASNDTLDMFAEMRAFAGTHPHVPSATILEMVTRNPARALGLEGRLGVLREGAWADAIAIPAPGPGEDLDESILNHTRNVAWMLINGCEVFF